MRWAGQPKDLSSREYALLERLALTPGRVHSPEALADAARRDKDARRARRSARRAA